MHAYILVLKQHKVADFYKDLLLRANRDICLTFEAAGSGSGKTSLVAFTKGGISSSFEKYVQMASCLFFTSVIHTLHLNVHHHYNNAEYARVCNSIHKFIRVQTNFCVLLQSLLSMAFTRMFNSH